MKHHAASLSSSPSSRSVTAITLAAVMLASSACAEPLWTHFAGSPQRVCITDTAPSSIASPMWVLSQHAGQPVVFSGPSSAVVDASRAYGLAEIGTQRRFAAVDRATGQIQWLAVLPTLSFSSWSTPALDTRNDTVLVACGPALTALDTATGVQRWQTALDRTTVNASPVVTSDLGAANRAFITDYDGFGNAGRLYCINVDPFDAGVNPYQPGEIVWSTTLGATSGNTPAYLDGVVYVACIAEDNTGAPMPGLIRAFDATAVTTPPPLWTFANVKNEGFFSGVAVQRNGGDVFLYAASFAFFGGYDTANLVKLNAADGSLLWSVDSNRTSTTPIPLPDGRVLISTGLRGSGNAPTIQMVEDRGASAVMQWSSAHETWVDVNTNGRLDPGEYLALGGWLHMPVVSTAGGRLTLYCGLIATLGGNYAPGPELYAIDLSRRPDEAGFVLEHFSGAGSTPSVAGGQLFAFGPGGLHAFGEVDCYADCDVSTGVGVLDIFDFLCFSNRFSLGEAYACDCDVSTGPGVCDIFDFLCFSNAFANGCP